MWICPPVQARRTYLSIGPSSWLQKIAGALDAAYAKSLIHRDLKPSNGMLTPNGVELLDFGLANLRDGDYREGAREPSQNIDLTRDGDLPGTLPYMSPEQIEGQEIDARTDIFSFGVVLYEMKFDLAGR